MGPDNAGTDVAPDLYIQKTLMFKNGLEISEPNSEKR